MLQYCCTEAPAIMFILMEKRKISVNVRREYLNKQFCREEARRLVRDGLLSGMSERQIAKELYFHAIVFYFCDKTGRFGQLKAKADPIDLCDGGDTKLRRAAYSAAWAADVPGHIKKLLGTIRGIKR